ncbi:hypothetical protein AZH53_10020 [Methanomicrobiaceae archaeon CYW5]|nr:hypothetical protein [Methanovulcanius yangii]
MPLFFIRGFGAQAPYGPAPGGTGPGHAAGLMPVVGTGLHASGPPVGKNPPARPSRGEGTLRVRAVGVRSPAGGQRGSEKKVCSGKIPADIS